MKEQMGSRGEGGWDARFVQSALTSFPNARVGPLASAYVVTLNFFFFLIVNMSFCQCVFFSDIIFIEV